MRNSKSPLSRLQLIVLRRIELLLRIAYFSALTVKIFAEWVTR